MEFQQALSMAQQVTTTIIAILFTLIIKKIAIVTAIMQLVVQIYNQYS